MQTLSDKNFIGLQQNNADWLPYTLTKTAMGLEDPFTYWFCWWHWLWGSVLVLLHAQISLFPYWQTTTLSLDCLQVCFPSAEASILWNQMKLTYGASSSSSVSLVFPWGKEFVNAYLCEGLNLDRTLPGFSDHVYQKSPKIDQLGPELFIPNTDTEWFKQQLTNTTATTQIETPVHENAWKLANQFQWFSDALQTYKLFMDSLKQDNLNLMERDQTWVAEVCNHLDKLHTWNQRFRNVDTIDTHTSLRDLPSNLTEELWSAFEIYQNAQQAWWTPIQNHLSSNNLMQHQMKFHIVPGQEFTSNLLSVFTDFWTETENKKLRESKSSSMNNTET